jgi:hypothetical protein
MARPKKDNAEYFPHDAGMRNDDRVKALRKRYKHTGYAIWNMLIEYLTSKDHFQVEYNDLTIELMAGDFDADVSDIKDVVTYCLTLGLLQMDGEFLMCKTLAKRLDPLLSKRKRDRTRVIDSENPQRKVKESKGEERKELTPVIEFVPVPDAQVVGGYKMPETFKDKPEAFEYLKGNYLVIQEGISICAARGWRGVDEIDIVGFIKTFINAKAKMDQPPDQIRQHFKNWLFREKLDNLNTIAVNFKKQLK